MILVLAFLFPAVNGWAVDDCCPGGPALLWLGGSHAPGLTASSHDDADAGADTVPTACSCSFCETLLARTGVPGIEPPAGLERVSAPPGKSYSSRNPSEVFRPPLA